MQYTAGELAKILNVSARTIRFYDEKGILKPTQHTESGYRLYDESSIEKLEKILLLRFLDFSLDQIRDMEESDDMQQSLKEQERLLRQRKEHLERVLTAVEKAQTAKPEELWKNLQHIVEVIREREYVIEQYTTTDNLDKRINIHDYSTASVGFHPWMLEQLDLQDGMKILDIGCGTGRFWEAVASTLPRNLELHLVDYSEEMLDKVTETMEKIRKQYPQLHLQYRVERADATDFQYDEYEFDHIMANHMLYHLKKEQRLPLYEQILKRLKPEGRFSCSLIGKTHMQELHRFVHKNYPQIYIMSQDFDIWLENAAEEELGDYFGEIATLEQENDLMVPEDEVLYDYVSSYSALAVETVKKDRARFMEKIRKEMNRNGCMYIHKSTGVIICKK